MTDWIGDENKDALYKIYLLRAKIKYRNEKDGFAFGCMTKKQSMEYIACEQAYEAYQYWKALKEIFKFEFKKNDVYGFNHKLDWVLCIFALLLNRKQHGADFPSYQNSQILCIWSEPTYGGWNGYFLDFHRKTFTYSIYSDGDCYL